MPMKWTAENDQVLLLKILETHDLALDTKKVAAAWPADAPEKPTPRAISERLFRMRRDLKSSGDGASFTIGKGTGTVTPRKRSTTKGKDTPGSGGSKRKRTANNINDDDDFDFHFVMDTPSRKVKNVKMEKEDEEDLKQGVLVTPAKRNRVRRSLPEDMVADSGEEEEEEQVESSGAEYVPEDFGWE